MAGKNAHDSIQSALEVLRGLTPEQRQGLKDFWGVYRERHGEAYDQAWQAIALDPHVAAWIATLSPEERARRRASSRQRLADAMDYGRWQPYLEELRAQGAALAEQAVPYFAWYELYRAFYDVVLPELHRTYGADPPRFMAAIRAMNILTDIVMLVIGQSYLDTKEEIILRQQAAISELSTPTLQVRKGLVVVPLIGAFDGDRSLRLREQVLARVRSARARVVLFDVTGVPIMDTRTTHDLLQTAAAARLLGATAIVTGISPNIAMTMVSLGLDLKNVLTAGDLEGGIETAGRLLEPAGEATPSTGRPPPLPPQASAPPSLGAGEGAPSGTGDAGPPPRGLDV